MSDLIKKVKIKKQDDTYTDYIPIGADAKNISMDNGKDVESVIGNINIDNDGSIATQLDKFYKIDKKKSNNITPVSNKNYKNLELNNTNTSFSSGIRMVNGETNISMRDINSNDASYGAIIGNENGAASPTHITLENSKIISKNGISMRASRNDALSEQYISILNNELETLNSQPGIESWTGGSLILGNKVKNPTSTGGYGGITLGAKPYQMASFNRVSGFGYGIEIGNVQRGVIVTNNIITDCGTGICHSSSGKEETVIISNNYIKIRPNGVGISISGGKRAIIQNCIIEFESDGNYNDTASRSGYGISVQNLEDLIINGCTFLNLGTAVKGGGTNGTRITNCSFRNCSNSVYAEGDIRISNCLFENVRNTTQFFSINKSYQRFVISHTFIKYSDDYSGSLYPMNGRGNSTLGIFEIESCSFQNAKDTLMVTNATAGGRDIRPLLMKKDGIYHSFNSSKYSDIITALTNNNLSLKEGDIIIDDYNGNKWQVGKGNTHKEWRAAGPLSTETYVKGDIVYNTFATTQDVYAWIYDGNQWKTLSLNTV